MAKDRSSQNSDMNRNSDLNTGDDRHLKDAIDITSAAGRTNIGTARRGATGGANGEENDEDTEEGEATADTNGENM